MTPQLFHVYSNPTTQFTEALAAANSAFTPPFIGSAIYDLPALPMSGSGRYLIRAIRYLAVQNVGLEFDFFAYGASAGQPSNLIATDAFIARYQFAAANGVQYNSTGLYRYYVDGLAIPYADGAAQNSATIPRQVHLGVQNIDTVAKSAGAPGAIRITIWLEPLGYHNG